MTTLDEIILAAWLWVEQLAEAGQETADQSGTSSPVSKNNILDSVVDMDPNWIHIQHLCGSESVLRIANTDPHW